jgi:hypothetical protein
MVGEKVVFLFEHERCDFCGKDCKNCEEAEKKPKEGSTKQGWEYNPKYYD